MKKEIQLLVVALAIAAYMPVFASCEKNPLPTEPETITLTATMEQPTTANSTKTALGTTSGGTTSVNWSTGDVIKIFATESGTFQTTGDDYTLSGTGGTTSGAFTGPSFTGGRPPLIAYYPAANVTSITAAGVLTVTLPATQTYVAGSFGNGAAPMVAYAETETLNFKNLCGIVKLSLKGSKKVRSITLSSHNHILSGTGTVINVTTGTPVLTMTAGGSNEVTLDCGGGVQLNGSTATDFYIVVPPTTEATTNGFVVQIVTTDASNNTMTKVATARASNLFVRNNILNMPEFAFSADLQYGDGFGYWGTGTLITAGDPAITVIWAPVNCGYHSSYSYGKLYQWGRKYGQGYNDRDHDYPSSENGNLVSGQVSVAYGNDVMSNLKFYYGNEDWANDSRPTLWNSGTETAPVKTDYDPCPAGWRVPTKTELEALISLNNSPVITKGQHGSSVNLDGVYFPAEGSNRVFLPAAGWREYEEGKAEWRREEGYYWSSSANGVYAVAAEFDGDYGSSMEEFDPATGMSVRCVREHI